MKQQQLQQQQQQQQDVGGILDRPKDSPEGVPFTPAVIARNTGGLVESVPSLADAGLEGGAPADSCEGAGRGEGLVLGPGGASLPGLPQPRGGHASLEPSREVGTCQRHTGLGDNPGVPGPATPGLRPGPSGHGGLYGSGVDATAVAGGQTSAAAPGGIQAVQPRRAGGMTQAQVQDSASVVLVSPRSGVTRTPEVRAVPAPDLGAGGAAPLEQPQVESSPTVVKDPSRASNSPVPDVCPSSSSFAPAGIGPHLSGSFAGVVSTSTVKASGQMRQKGVEALPEVLPAAGVGVISGGSSTAALAMSRAAESSIGPQDVPAEGPGVDPL